MATEPDQRREADLLAMIRPDAGRIRACAEMLALLRGNDEPASNGTTDEQPRTARSYTVTRRGRPWIGTPTTVDVDEVEA